MLGLLKGTVKLSEHQENWGIVFQDTKDLLMKNIGDQVLDIQHIGSTSIKNIPAKPILDIAILIENLSSLENLKKPLESLRYDYRGDKGQRGGELFVLESSPGVRTQHLHIVVPKDPQWEKWVRFRDYLNQNVEVAKAYGDLKRKLEEQYPDNRPSYTRAKDGFVKNVIDLIFDKNQKNA